MPSAVRTPSVGTHNNPESPDFIRPDPLAGLRLGPQHELGVIASGDEADTDGEPGGRRYGNRGAKINYRDFENEKDGATGTKSPEVKSKKKTKKKRKHRKSAGSDDKVEDLPEKKSQPASEEKQSVPRVGFAQDVQIAPESAPKRPFIIRGLSVRPTLPSLLSSTVFSSVPPAGPPVIGPGAPTTMPRTINGVRRTASLPDRLNKAQLANPVSASTAQPYIRPVNVSQVSTDLKSVEKAKEHISRTTAVVLLLVSTGLVAICAEFLVGSINYLVANSGVSEAFVGLIILPIVGNAAEHVTAVTVASKNKMDLAIGVAVGSSIQIGKFAALPGFLFPPILCLHPSTDPSHMHSPLCHPSHCPPRLDPVKRHVPLLLPLRDRLPLRFGLYRQLPRPRRPQQLPRGRPVDRRVYHHRRRCLFLS